MYGLVNKAIQDMVCDRFGEAIWKEIQHKAEIEIDDFISMEAYPDDLTHKLVKAASLVLGLSASEIMQAFGEFWVQYTCEEGYGELMSMSGETLPEFLHNLDNLHARLEVSFPKLQPPSFTCEQAEAQTLNLQYHSVRSGLAPMVVGLIKGLGARFDTDVEIVQLQNKAHGAAYDEFSIRHKPI